MSVTIQEVPHVANYPWRLTCDECAFVSHRSTQAKAEAQGKEHERCHSCAYGGTHCSTPCNTCFGHCESWCYECDGHCSTWCDNCYGHCDYNCGLCSGHCDYWCDICDSHCDHEDPGCDDCHRNSGSLDNVHPYTFKPDPIFHGEGKLQVGLELEVSWGDLRKADDWLRQYVMPQPNLWYAKEDSSVDMGFEVVTHPMTTGWAQAHFPFEAIERAVDSYGAIPEHDSTGTHVHMSRDGLNGRQWWTMFAIHRKLPGLCGHIGGRGTDSEWARWDHAERVLSHPIQAKGGYRKLMEAGIYTERYSPLNVQPEATIEMRYPAGDFTPEGVRRNVQWVEALTTFGTDTPCYALRINESALIDHINRQPWPELQQRVATY